MGRRLTDKWSTTILLVILGQQATKAAVNVIVAVDPINTFIQARFIGVILIILHEFHKIIS